jgi:Hydrazine synthase alpha subunit middle domain
LGIVLLLLILAAGAVWVNVSADSSSNQNSAPVMYTSAAQYDRDAWLRGGERFPAGAQVMVREGGKSRTLVTGFAATADPAVSFDGTRALFAGKREARDAWQIWEVALSGGEARRITTCEGDCVRPFYLPGGRLVYAQKMQGRFVLQSAEFESGKTLQLSYAPGNAMPTDVLHDGRILFEAAYPIGSGTTPEIYTVYSDGSGVESYRCDHGPKRQAGKQVASGDIVFASERGLGRFTSAVAHQVEVKTPAGEFAGDAVQVAAEEWLVSWRPDVKAVYELQSWNTKTGSLTALVSARDANLLQPAVVAPRPVPNLHPSGLHEWSYANLLCLNAYTSKYKFAPGSVAAMKLYTTDEKGKPKLLGSSPVEADGSFYVQVPGDRPLQIELLDRQGKTLQREHGWWWASKGEQRICVGCHAGPERSPENAVPAVLVKSTKPVVMTRK